MYEMPDEITHHTPPVITPSPRKSVQPLAILSVALIIVGAYFFGFQTGKSQVGFPVQQGVAHDETLDLSPLYAAKKYLDANFLYADRLDPKVMSYGAAKGLAASLDDSYTNYYAPDEAKDFHDFLFTELEGIGAELILGHDGIITVVSPLKGQPAESAGILPKDRILEIDGEPAGSDLFDAVKRIKGPAGTEVCLTILHDGDFDTEEICIVRKFIDIPAVESKSLDNGMYHVSLSTFDNTAPQELRKTLEEIITHNPRGIIFDLRFNGGGFLDGATRIASLFLPAGKTVTRVEARNNNSTHDEVTSGTPLIPEIPMVLLVNKGSASASEIVSAALQYYGRAKIVGERTFGKDTAQEIIDLADGSLLRLTIAKWLTPGGDSLHEGLAPDIDVVNDPETDADEQLDKAIEVLEEVI
jgi:carboxyl-terminal processing protease